MPRMIMSNWGETVQRYGRMVVNNAYGPGTVGLDELAVGIF